MEHSKRNVLFCLESFKPLHLTSTEEVHADIAITEGFDFSEALESVYPLMEIILSYLSLEELRIASKVKESWNIIANQVLEKRIQPDWFVCTTDESRKMWCSFRRRAFNNIGLGIVLYDYKFITLSKYICIHDNINPTRKTAVEYLADDIIPKNTDYCVISCPGIDTMFGDSKTVLQPQVEPLFGGLLLPSLPNLRTAMIKCNLKKSEDAEQVVQSYLRPNETTRCIILFCKRDLSRTLNKFLEYIINGNNPKTVACGGGIIRGIKTFQQIESTQKDARIHKDTDIFCIGFFQSDKCDFNAYSVVIKGDDLSKHEFEAELLKFKQKIRLRAYTVGLRICCAAKFETSDEMIVFKDVFPGVQLLSFDADGEIGWNCYSNDSDANDEKKVKKSKFTVPQLQHQWSTVIILLTWGNV